VRLLTFLQDHIPAKEVYRWYLLYVMLLVTVLEVYFLVTLLSILVLYPVVLSSTLLGVRIVP